MSHSNLVPKKYKLRFGDVNCSLSRREDCFPLHKNTALLKEPGLYCFFLRCKKPRAEPFMEWIVETVLQREVQKLALAIKEKDNHIEALEFTNRKHKQKILRLNKEIDDLVANRHVARRGFFDNVLCFIKKNTITLFDVSTGSLKNINDGLNFVTQTCRWPTNVMIQTPFINGTGLSEK